MGGTNAILSIGAGGELKELVKGSCLARALFHRRDCWPVLLAITNPRDPLCFAVGIALFAPVTVFDSLNVNDKGETITESYFMTDDFVYIATHVLRFMHAKHHEKGQVRFRLIEGAYL